MDVPKESIDVTLAEAGGEVRRFSSVGGDRVAVQKLHVVYEAGPCGSRSDLPTKRVTLAGVASVQRLFSRTINRSCLHFTHGLMRSKRCGRNP